MKKLELPISVIDTVMIVNSTEKTNNPGGKAAGEGKIRQSLSLKHSLYKQLVVKFLTYKIR
jgi:hypothetical protein